MASYNSEQFEFLMSQIVLKSHGTKNFKDKIEKTKPLEFFGFGAKDPFPSSSEFNSNWFDSLKFKILTAPGVITKMLEYHKFRLSINRRTYDFKTKNGQSLFKEYSDNCTNIMDIVGEEEFLYAASRYDSSYIYKRFNNWKNGKNDLIKADTFHETILLAYVGIENHKKLDELMKATKSRPQNIHYTYYTCHYYSFYHKDILQFELGVDFSKIIEIIVDADTLHPRKTLGYAATQKGLHENQEHCSGYAYLVNQKLHVVLTYKENSSMLERIKFIINAGANPKNEPLMTGARSHSYCFFKKKYSFDDCYGTD